MTFVNLCLSLNVLCIVLLAGRCWVLEGRTAVLQVVPALPADVRRTQVWSRRKPTVFHRRRA